MNQEKTASLVVLQLRKGKECENISDQQSMSTAKVEYECHLCKKMSKSKHGLSMHLKYVHSDDKNFECKDCDKTFKSQIGRAHV